MAFSFTSNSRLFMSKGRMFDTNISYKVPNQLAVRRQALIYLNVLVNTAQCRKHLLF